MYTKRVTQNYNFEELLLEKIKRSSSTSLPPDPSPNELQKSNMNKEECLKENKETSKTISATSTLQELQEDQNEYENKKSENWARDGDDSSVHEDLKGAEEIRDNLLKIIRGRKPVRKNKY